MIESPPFDPPYKTIVKTATGATVTETLADGSTRDLGEIALSNLLVNENARPTIMHPKKTADPTQSGNAKAAIYLNVSFADKDKAKAKGAKWDAAKKQWYAPHGVDINAFKPWWPDSLK